MNKRQAVETVDFRINFKVKNRRNDTKDFTYSTDICTEQESESTASPEARHYLKLHVELHLHDIANNLTQN